MSSIFPPIFNPCDPHKANRPLERRVDKLGKQGEDAIVSVNISIRNEKADDARQAMAEVQKNLEREFGGNWNVY